MRGACHFMSGSALAVIGVLAVLAEVVQAVGRHALMPP